MKNIALSLFFMLAISLPCVSQEPTPSTNNNYVMVSKPVIPMTSGNLVILPLGKDDFQADTLTLQNSVTDIVYYDGLGDPVLNIAIGSSPQYEDIIVPVVYDNMRRNNSRIYLPYAGSGITAGAYRTDAANYLNYSGLYGDDAQYAFIENEFEASPLERIVKTYNAGTIFREDQKFKEYAHSILLMSVPYGPETGHNINFIYDLSYDDTSNTVSRKPHSKPCNRILTIDEDGNESFVYKNSKDQIIAEAVIHDTGEISFTYYIYDHLDRLICVVPPEGANRIGNSITPLNSSNVNSFCFLYKYDGRNRCIEKKLPGAEPVCMVYDKGDRLVITQDGNQRKNFEWTYFVYDDLGRLTEQSIVYGKEIPFVGFNAAAGGGLDSVNGNEMDMAASPDVTDGGSDHVNSFDPIEGGVDPTLRFIDREYLQSRYDSFDNSYKNLYKSPSAILKPFGDDTFTLVKHLGSTRYGGYRYGAPLLATEFQPMSTIIVGPAISFREYTIPEYLPFAPVEGVVDSYDTRTKGMKTYEKVAVLNGNSGSGDFVERAFYYDNRGRLVQTAEKNHQGGISRYSTKYDFTGNVLASHEAHSEEMPVPDDYVPFVQGLYFVITEPPFSKTKPIPVDPGNKYFTGDFSVKAEYYIGTTLLTDRLPEAEPIAFHGYYIPEDCMDIVTNSIAANIGNFSFLNYDFNYYDTFPNFSMIGVGEPLTHLGTPPVEVLFDTKLTTFDYDHRGRLLSETTTVNDSEPAIVGYTYDELGRLKSKVLGGAYGDQNIRVDDWLWLTFKSGNSMSSSFGSYFADKMINTYGITDWDRYNYIQEDGSINPEYFICVENKVTFYYFPYFHRGPDYESMIEIMHGFSGYSSWCFTPSEVAPTNIQLEQYIVLHSQFVMQTCDYNIQGWLTEQNSDLFSMKLKYYDPDLPQNSGVTPSYTGNITQWEWVHTDPENPGMQYNAYGFKYDALSRLTENRHYDRNPANGQWRPTETEFSEKGISYDKNGNIKTMNRRYYDFRSEEALSDMIKYEYTGNKLTSLYHENQSGMLPHFEYWADYEYDANGNMTWDERKGWIFKYNYLNLIDYIFDDETGDWPARYKWLADGTKLQVVNEAGVGAGYMYLGSLVYSRSDLFDEWHLESTGFGGGRIIASETSGGAGSGGVGGSEGLVYTPYYHLTDHLGSVRTVFTYETDDDDKPVPSVKSQNDYYPFGLRHINPLLAAGSDTENRFLYNGKENQTAGLLGLLDYGARMYDPIIARWFNIDPLAEKRYWVSPYNYTQNNPVNRVDKNGQIDRRVGHGETPGPEHRGSAITQRSHTVYRSDGKIAISITHNERYSDNSGVYTINGSSGNIVNVSNKSAIIISNSMQDASEGSVTITSTTRSPEKQANIMYDNITTYGIDNQKNLYGTAGDAVIDTYSTAVAEENNTREMVVQAMTYKINELGPQSVSRHCGDNSVVNVIDIAPSSVSDYRRFQNELSNNPGIYRVIKYPKDPAIHIEINL